MNIKEFSIKKLHGHKNYKIKFKDNKLIIVGENGAGKTTVLKILFYFLSGQWNALKRYDFASLSLVLNEKNFTIKKENIPSHKFSNRFLRNFPPPIREKILEATEMSEIEHLCDRFDVPFNLALRETETKQHNLFDDDDDDDDSYEETKLKQLQEIRAILKDTQIIYLPTYRRIEQELSSVLKGFDDDDFRMMQRRNMRSNRRRNEHIELVEFGMKDVVDSIKNTLYNLKEFSRENLNSLTLGYLGDVVEQKYENVNLKQIKEATDETIDNILDRIDKNILSDNSKRHLSDTIRKVKSNETLKQLHDKVLCHYFIKLLSFQQELEDKETKIRRFCEVCNQYMVDKKFKYDSSLFSCDIEQEHGDKNTPLQLNQLSSGEKQIISLFCHLYLSDKNKFFVMIDEPELSLSVPWQRLFLEDIANGDFCSGLLAVTHSPFIYENKLDKYAHSLGEFLTRG